jgi:hypothetical protein
MAEAGPHDVMLITRQTAYTFAPEANTPMRLRPSPTKSSVSSPASPTSACSRSGCTLATSARSIQRSRLRTGRMSSTAASDTRPSSSTGPISPRSSLRRAPNCTASPRSGLQGSACGSQRAQSRRPDDHATELCRRSPSTRGCEDHRTSPGHAGASARCHRAIASEWSCSSSRGSWLPQPASPSGARRLSALPPDEQAASIAYIDRAEVAADTSRGGSGGIAS